MIATANITYDRDYLELQYDEWLRHRSKKTRRYAIWFAVAPAVLGLAMTFTFQHQWLVGAVFASVGVYEFLMAVTHKRRWVNARVSSVSPSKSVQLEFETDSLTSRSEDGTGTMQISGFSEFTPASHGFFLIPDTGVQLYVPRATIAPSDSYCPLVELLSSTIGRPENPNGG